METVTPTQLATAIGISVPYAWQLLKGDRPVSLEMALRIFDATAMQLGPLTDLTAAEIETARKMVRAA
jgi:plasmid maintenance system antidote protein VapI